MATCSDILKKATSEIGTTEAPKNSNKVKYNTAYYGRAVSGTDYLWCCVFVWWVFKEAGCSDLFYGGKKTASCRTLLSFHKQAGQAVKGDYQPGDIIFFNFAGKSTPAHVGICESFDGKTITTIDGNTGTDNEANGGAVMRRKRDKKYIVDAYRPNYESGATKDTLATLQYGVSLPLLQKGSTGDSVKALQILLTGWNCSTRGCDGKFGANTDTAMRKFQREKGLTVDGKCGPASWTALLGM